MTTSTSRGVPIAEDTDAADIADRVNAVANVVHDRPGVKTVTTAERNALAGVELWDGRIIVNTTDDVIQRYDAGAGAWRHVAETTDLVTQTQAQAESDSDNIGRLTTGQRIFQAIVKRAVLLTGNQTIAGNKTFTDPFTIANNQVEIGESTGAPYVDFHSSPADYSSRIVASGGTGTNGSGDLQFQSASLRHNGVPLVRGDDNRLDPLTQAEAENNGSTRGALVTGQRLAQAIAKWAVTLSDAQTITGAKNFTGGLSSAGSAVLTDADLSGTAGAAPTTSGTVGTSGQAARRDHTHPARVASGTASISIPGGAPTGAVTVNFPAGAFTGAPRVVAMSYGSADFVMGILGNPTAASVNITARSVVGNAASGGATVAFHWVATQL